MGIRVECEQCGYKYHLKEELAGKKVKCKICKATFFVPTVDHDVVSDTAGGGKVIAHSPRTKEFEVAVGDEESIEAISDHIERHYGKIEMVYHEVISDLVHIDVHWVAPSGVRPYHTLVTSGMSDRPMRAPEGAEAFRYGEMMICLPPTWRMSMEDWEDEKWYWPVRWLKILARFPHEYDTWLAPSHTVPNEDPPQPFASNTKLCCSLVMPPLLAPEGFSELKISDEKTIRFCSLVPLYREEMEFKLKRGFDSLVELLDKNKVTELLDVGRRNVCKKGWW